MRLDLTKTRKEATYQVVLDTLKLSPCYNTFLITIDVPKIYMHQFWFTISKIKDTSSYQFKLDKKKFRICVEVFTKILQICPILHNQEFFKPPSHEEIVTFIKEIGYRGELKSITELYIDHMSQPWITFASIINKCLSGKSTEETRLVHETHECLVTEKSTRRRRQTRVAIRYTPTVTKKKTLVPSLKLKGIEMLSDAAMLAANIRKAMKASLRDLCRIDIPL
ncbi:hypothetical protein Tco_0392931 [Tanacetum coccineum]